MYVYIYIFAYVNILYTCAATLGMHIVVFEKSWQMSLYTSPTLRNTKRVCCSVLQCVAACCIVRQCDGVAMCGRCHHTLPHPAHHRASVLQCVAVCGIVLHCVAVWCVAMCGRSYWTVPSPCAPQSECAAVCCGVLQCVAVWCDARSLTIHIPCPAHHTTSVLRVCVLQCVAMYCSVLQCVAVWCVAMWGRCHHKLLPLCAPHSECVAVCCSVSQSVAVSVLHCVVVCNSVACCSVLQCSILQCVADVTVYFPHPAYPRHDQKKICCSVCCSAAISGYFSRTWLSCSHMVVKTLLYCTRKCSCKGGCMSASYFLQPPRNGSTGPNPVLEHETVSRTLLLTPRTCLLIVATSYV